MGEKGRRGRKIGKKDEKDEKRVLLGSYYKYWSYKCFIPYFLDQPVLISVKGGKFFNQYV